MHLIQRGLAARVSANIKISRGVGRVFISAVQLPFVKRLGSAGAGSNSNLRTYASRSKTGGEAIHRRAGPARAGGAAIVRGKYIRQAGGGIHKRARHNTSAMIQQTRLSHRAARSAYAVEISARIPHEDVSGDGIIHRAGERLIVGGLELDRPGRSYFRRRPGEDRAEAM